MKTSLITILFILLALLIAYHWIFPENGDYQYRPKNGRGLLSWTKPFQPCIIDNNVDDILGRTPILGVDKRGSDFAYRISVALWTNVWLALSSAVVFILLATLSGVLVGYDQSPETESLYQRIKGSKSIIGSLREVKILQTIAKWIVQALHAIPLLLLLLVVVVVANKLFENDLVRMLVIMVTVGVLSIPKLALLIQDRISVLEDEEFINAARASGLSDSKIILTHILWYECSPIIAGQFIYVIVQAIMLETVISFLGYGFGIDHTSLGGLIKQYQGNLPGAIGGTPLALLPLVVLLLIAVVGNGLTNLFMELRHE
ncbi:MAG: ABC transporter permease subunit [Bacteroidetes bacterium]|nr:ABC transporter permease subunit [Bacteroidota bacterium]